MMYILYSSVSAQGFHEPFIFAIILMNAVSHANFKGMKILKIRRWQQFLSSLDLVPRHGIALFYTDRGQSHWHIPGVNHRLY
jgi:hypothetical protein